MFYEEKFENGHWYSRSTPDGEWIQLSYAALEEKIQSLLAYRDKALIALDAEESLVKRGGPYDPNATMKR